MYVKSICIIVLYYVEEEKKGGLLSKNQTNMAKLTT